MGTPAGGVFLRQSERGPVVGFGALKVGLGSGLVDLAAVGEGGRIVGVELDRLIEVGNGAREVTLALVRETAVVPAQRVLAVDPDRLAVIGDGAIEIALGAQRIGAIVIGVAVVGIELDCLAVVGNGLVEILLAEPEQAPAVVGNCKLAGLGLDLSAAGGDTVLGLRFDCAAGFLIFIRAGSRRSGDSADQQGER